MSLNQQLESDESADLLKDRPKMFDESDRDLDFDDVMGSIDGNR